MEIPEADPNALIELANYRMPFGMHKGTRLIDLPEPYVVWFSQQGFPRGKLGDLLRSVYEIKVNGLEHLFEPLRRQEVRDSLTDRECLLQAALWFVPRAGALDEVLSVALIGSICTPKPDPGDIDLLVRVRPDADLAALAELARGMLGRIQRGLLDVDVLLVEDLRYIGRVCTYGDPWPRARCTATGLRCTTRSFLCETSPALRPDPAVLQNPPLVLRPRIEVLSALPPDVTRFIEALKTDPY